MTAAVLTLNAGSSSLKVSLYPAEGETPLATALADRIGPEGRLILKDASGQALALGADPAAGVTQEQGAVQGLATSHAAAMEAIMAALLRRWPDLQLQAIGHRVVHGGAKRRGPARVDGDLLAELEALSPFAPLHQPHNLAGIRAALAAFPGVPQVACFDTAFHRDQPFINQTFALPRRFFAEGLRRYGFHGLSYEWVAGLLAEEVPAVAAGRVVVAHLGNGASLCALQGGRSIASTMGFSPLDGLAMGTRCGQIDPGVLLYLLQQKGLSAEAVSDLLYRESGLLGLSGLSNDMRQLEAAGSAEAAEAIAYFVARCQREIAAMAAALGGLDALVFCGGIGENAWRVRALICEGLGWMGVALDPERNAAGERVISCKGATRMVLVIPTNEERVIARAARSLRDRSVDPTVAAEA